VGTLASSDIGFASQVLHDHKQPFWIHLFLRTYHLSYVKIHILKLINLVDHKRPGTITYPYLYVILNPVPQIILHYKNSLISPFIFRLFRLSFSILYPLSRGSLFSSTLHYGTRAHSCGSTPNYNRVAKWRAEGVWQMNRRVISMSSISPQPFPPPHPLPPSLESFSSFFFLELYFLLYSPPVWKEAILYCTRETNECRGEGGNKFNKRRTLC